MFIAMLVMLISSLSLTSCGDDEPELLIGYYMSIHSQVGLTLSPMDESQGTTSSPEADMLSLTIVRMRAALHNVYSRPTVTGNDAAVITACDNIYNEYHAKYAGVERNTVCVVKIYRARMADGIVKESIPLKTYHFGAQPPEPE